MSEPRQTPLPDIVVRRDPVAWAAQLMAPDPRLDCLVFVELPAPTPEPWHPTRSREIL